MAWGGNTVLPFLTVTGDLTVGGNIILAGGLTFEDAIIIDFTGAEAFLVRKDGDTGDGFTVDTTNDNVEIGSGFQIHLDAGAVDAPAIAFTSDVDTGDYLPAVDMMARGAGGIEAFRTSEGNSEVATVFGHNVVQNAITGVTSNGTAVIAKAGIETGVSIGDVVQVYAGSTAGDFGTYIVQTVSVADQLTLMILHATSPHFVKKHYLLVKTVFHQLGLTLTRSISE